MIFKKKNFIENVRINDIISEMIKNIKYETDGTLKLEKYDKIQDLILFIDLIKLQF